jgi:hypothetical protein
VSAQEEVPLSLDRGGWLALTAVNPLVTRQEDVEHDEIGQLLASRKRCCGADSVQT